MTCNVFTSHLDLDGDTLIGALFLTYRLDLSAFEEWVLPQLLPMRHPPGEALFAEEARRRIAEAPIVIVADASCLEQASADGDATGGTCGVSVIRFTQPTGAFHPKLGLLACKARGVRVVIGSANLTEAGITNQIELVSSFWLNDHPSAVPGLRATLRALDKRLATSPAYLRAAKVVERAFPKPATDETSVLVLCSVTSILDQALAAIADDTNGTGRVEEVSIASPFFERGKEDRSLLDRVAERIRKHLPRSRDPHYVLRMSTDDSKAPYRVEAPIDRFRAFEQTASLECRVLTPGHRMWEDDPKSEDVGERRPRALHGKLITLRVKHGNASWVYTLLGSPNFTKAALLGGNFETALLQRAGKAPSGIELPADKVSMSDLIEVDREFAAPPRETSCIERVLLTVAAKELAVIATENMTIPESLSLRARGQPQPWERSGENVVVRPFDDVTCPTLEVSLGGAWFTLPIEIVDPDVSATMGSDELSLEQLLARSASYAEDPDGMGMGRGRRTPNAKHGKAPQLTSISDVAPQLKNICDLAIALETSLADAPTPEALFARFRAYFAPTLQALANGDPPSQLRSRTFALLDVQRAAERLRRSVPASDKERRSTLDAICAECAALVTQLEKASAPASRSLVTDLRRRFETV